MESFDGVDGVAFQNMHRGISSNSVATIPEGSLTFEYNELKRKLDRKEVDYKRKEKECVGYQKEIARIHKEVKLSAAEMQSLRDRNDQLQQSLINSRLLSQNARDDADSKLSNTRIRELESALGASIHKFNISESDNESLKQTVQLLQSKLQNFESQVESLRSSESKAVDELVAYRTEAKTKEAVLDEKLKSANAAMKELNDANITINNLRNEIEQRKLQSDQNERAFNDLKEDFRKLRSTLEVRSETNSVLRAQLEEINGSKFTISKDEMERLKGYEAENKKVASRNKDLSKSVDLYMGLLTRAESEKELVQKEYKDLQLEHSKIKADLSRVMQEKGTSLSSMKTLKAEVVQLRRDNKEMVAELKELKENPAYDVAEIRNMKTGLLTLEKSKHDEIELKQEEKKKRFAAEESLKALRSRVSFLLEQLDQASQLSVAWQEEKTLMQAELAALHSTNSDLRQRLAYVQQTYVTRHIRELPEEEVKLRQSVNGTKSRPVDGEPWTNNTQLAFGKQPAQLTEAEDVLTGRSGKNISEFGGVFNKAITDVIPNSPESAIERALFDITCAFSSGVRSKPKGPKGSRRKKGSVKSVYRVQQDEHEGTCDIVVATDENPANYDADAAEMLNGLQIPAFLKFAVSRPTSKLFVIFAEKIASMLNFFRASIVDLLEDISDSRMEVAKSMSKTAVSNSRFDQIRDRFVKERFAKQKMIMKYIREQMKHSDMRVVIDQVVKKARDQLDEIEATPDYGGWQASAVNATKDLFIQLVQVADQLALAGASSGTNTGPVGGLEIRLPQSLVDDETLNGVISLICGVFSFENYSSSGVNAGDFHGEEAVTNNKEIDDAVITESSLTVARVFHNPKLTENYISRILLLNLRNNQLTDLSAKLLASFVEKSSELRMLDIRENYITEAGAKLLFDATRKNPSILYVTQKQGGFMIEGHREIVGSTQAQPKSMNRDSFERLVGSIKHPLRIDIRDNTTNQHVMQGFLDSIEFKHKSEAESEVAHTEASESVDRMGGKWTASGIIKNTPSKLDRAMRPQSASSPGRTSLNRPPLNRPHSAYNTRGANTFDIGTVDEDDDDDDAKGLNVSIGVKSLRNSYNADNYHAGSNDASNIQEVIQRRQSNDKLTGPTELFNATSAGTGAKGKIGSIIDEQIRQMQESGGKQTTMSGSVVTKKGIAESSPLRKEAKRELTVRERTLTKTKAVYSSTMKIPGDDKEDDLLSKFHHGNSTMNTPTKFGPKGVKSDPLFASPLPRPNSANSIVRDRLQSAKERSLTVQSPRTHTSSAHPGSAKKKMKSKSPHSLLDSLQKLNPGVLF